MKQYYIYLTTNLINNKKYIGMHYRELDDSYLGSGDNIQKAIKKYGKNNFKKEILYISKDEKENAEKEKYYINLYNAIENKDFYNIHEGGFGGNTIAGWTQEQKEQYHNKRSLRAIGEKNPRYGVSLSDEIKDKIRQARLKNNDIYQTEEYKNKMSLLTKGEHNGMYGKKHSEESKQKMSNKKVGKKLKDDNGNSKEISAYLDEEHTQLVQHFKCMQDALIFVGTNPKDYSGIVKRIKENKKYKGYYWVRECRD